MSETGSMIDADAFGTCPVPQSRYEHVVLGHGGGAVCLTG